MQKWYLLHLMCSRQAIASFMGTRNYLNYWKPIMKYNSIWLISSSCCFAFPPQLWWCWPSRCAGCPSTWAVSCSQTRPAVTSRPRPCSPPASTSTWSPWCSSTSVPPSTQSSTTSCQGATAAHCAACWASPGHPWGVRAPAARARPRPLKERKSAPVCERAIKEQHSSHHPAMSILKPYTYMERHLNMQDNTVPCYSSAVHCTLTEPCNSMEGSF